MTKKNRRPNYRSRSSAGTQRKHRVIASLLLSGEGLTLREIGRALGMSRQLVLYHVKKMAAEGQLVMVVEACEANSGIQFRVWNELALATHYSRKLLQTPVEMMRRAA